MMMQTRIFFYLCISLFFWGSPRLIAIPSQELFLQGNQAYEAGAYAQALKFYESIEDKGPAVWFNMGNCFYQQDSAGAALVSWRRAQRGASGSLYRAAQRNIDLIQAGGDRRQVWWQPIYQLIMYIVAFVGLGFLQIIFLFCLFIILVLLKSLSASMMRRLLFCIAVGMILVVGVCIAVSWYDMLYDHAVVKEKQVSIYAGPGCDYHVIGTCSHLQEFAIRDKKGVWYKIRGAGQRGWIQKDSCEVI